MISKLTDDMNVIAGLDSRPNLRDGMTDAELKAKFDEAANLIKTYINEKLIPDIKAKNIPFESTSGNVNGETILEALEWLKDQIAQSQLGAITNGTITEEKLSAAVRNILHSGKPLISETQPEDPSEEVKLSPGQLWLRTVGGNIADLNILLDDGTWLSFGEPVLPVRKGGTGVGSVGAGALLVGGDAAALQVLAAPDSEDTFLSVSAGKPVWKKADAVKGILGYLNVAEGEYTGNDVKREIELTADEKSIAPKIVVVYRVEGAADRGSGYFEDTVCLCEGAQKGIFPFLGTQEQLITVMLKNGKLVFGNKTNASDTALAPFMNWKDNVYRWLALY